MEKKEKSVAVAAKASYDGDHTDPLKFVHRGSNLYEADDETVQCNEKSLDDSFWDKNPYDTLALLEEEEEEVVEECVNNLHTERKKHKTENARLKELGRLNGQINRMKLDKLKKKLREFNLDTSGTRMVLQRRLKSHYKRQDVKESDYHYDHYVVIDFEATCDVQPNHFRHEIIEFPAILISTKKRKIIGKFHSYVRPVVNPKLTTFCTNLTGITQDQVNFAPEFPEVLSKFEEWLKEKKLKTNMKSFAVVTDGPWDMGRFLFYQCKISKLTYPQWAKTWINIKKPFCNYYNTTTERMNLQKMLAELGMSFVGQPHSGLDDAYNIARVAMKLFEDGANMRENEQICFQKPKGRDQRAQTVKNISRNSFNAMIKRRNVDPPNNSTKGGNSNNGNEDESPEESTSEYQDMSESEGHFLDTNNEEEFPSLLSKPLKDLN